MNLRPQRHHDPAEYMALFLSLSVHLCAQWCLGPTQMSSGAKPCNNTGRSQGRVAVIKMSPTFALPSE